MSGITLRAGDTRALVLPDEGGVAAELSVGAFDVLARTPWAASARPAPVPAEDEATWVGRWRGGWQLCFPTAGAADPDARPRQGFHGVASQDAWTVRRVGESSAELAWADEAGLSAARRWSIGAGTLGAVTTAVNGGADARRIIVAEHLVLGQDVLAHLTEADGTLGIQASGTLAELDYAGNPTGRATAWPGHGWDRANRSTPARVAALQHPVPRVITVTGPHLRATVSWEGLEHALLWEEFGASREAPWGGAVHALGVEPTSTPHGAGTAHPGGIVELGPGESMTWATRLDLQVTERTTLTRPVKGERR
ncbi:hypothetical protein HDC37_000230 [Microbacterium sp. AK009]|uniref:hypothetical protein n=1 Tax=Microbacterium sp. AK009 TaxID=2723068 RepID=UPI0015C72DB1|nr:hypothetical protein [Microbacterium sp. AK009]NYF15418.1 hypothetical protein [Microbacterium sp. AK009]